VDKTRNTQVDFVGLFTPTLIGGQAGERMVLPSEQNTGNTGSKQHRGSMGQGERNRPAASRYICILFTGTVSSSTIESLIRPGIEQRRRVIMLEDDPSASGCIERESDARGGSEGPADAPLP